MPPILAAIVLMFLSVWHSAFYGGRANPMMGLLNGGLDGLEPSTPRLSSGQLSSTELQTPL